jgi:ABC-2 type transport system ATP-binding protein
MAMSNATPAIEVSQVCKTFRNTSAVLDLSFSVNRGEVFGMVGPNGAGKTTTLRMLMDILRPDSGEIRILGNAIDEPTKDRIGYLPEERGLYRKVTVRESLAYLAALKGMTGKAARERASALLERVGMAEHRDKKAEELSRGMGQIIQFVATILHDPDLVVLDEPFSGLDPVNTEMLKSFILELKGQGKAVILSTHMMNQVEELCDRFLMMNKGRAVLYGSLGEIKSRYRTHSVLLACDRVPDDLPGVIGRRKHGRHTELLLDEQTTPSEVLAALVGSGTNVERFEVATPSLNEIFIQVVQEAS